MVHINNFLTAKCLLNFVIALAVIFVGVLQPRAQDSASDTFGKRLTLIEMEQRKVSANGPYLEFDREQERVSGSGGCNRFSGAFEVDGSSMRFSRIVSTRMACIDAERQRVESTFLRLLETITRFEAQGNTLRLFANHRPVLVLAERAANSETGAASGSTALNGTSWQLVKFQSSDGNTVVPDDKSKYKIIFGNTGRASVRLDCNRGGGSWKSEGANQLRFGPMIITQVMCPPGSLNDRIANDLWAVRSYVVKDGNLFLSLMADGGIYEFEPIGGSGPKKTREAHVTGDVSYRQRIALTPRAVVEVRLLDVSRADASSTTIAEQTIRPGGRQVPISFDLVYDLERIDPRGRYTIQVRILDRNRLRFTNSQAYPVITNGHPNEVNVIVTPVIR